MLTVRWLPHYFSRIRNSAPFPSRPALKLILKAALYLRCFCCDSKHTTDFCSQSPVLFRVTLPCLAVAGTTWEGRWGNRSPPSDSDTIAAYSCAPNSSPHTSRSEGFIFFPSFTYLFLTQCNGFHRAAQEKWNGGQTAGCHLPSLRATPNPFTGHWALPCIKPHL